MPTLIVFNFRTLKVHLKGTETPGKKDKMLATEAVL